MPTQPAIAVCAPMRTLWPIWIRLSSLTPSLDHGVAERRRGRCRCWRRSRRRRRCARAPSCSIFSQRPACGREAEAVGADHGAGVDDAARADGRVSARGSTRGASRVPRRCGSRAPTTACAPMRAPSPMTAPASITANGADRRRRRRSRAAGSIAALAMDAGRRPAAACARPTTGSGGRSRGTGRRVTIAAPRASGRVAQRRRDDDAAGARAGELLLVDAGWRGSEMVDGVGRLERRDARRCAAAGSPISSPPSRPDDLAERGTRLHPVTCRPRR